MKANLVLVDYGPSAFEIALDAHSDLESAMERLQRAQREVANRQHALYRAKAALTAAQLEAFDRETDPT